MCEKNQFIVWKLIVLTFWLFVNVNVVWGRFTKLFILSVVTYYKKHDTFEIPFHDCVRFTRWLSDVHLGQP